MSNIHSEVVEMLHENYYRREVEANFSKLVKKFVKANMELCKEEGMESEHIGYALGSSMSYIKLKKLVAIPFSTQNLFDAFREFLPKSTLTGQCWKSIRKW